MKHLYLVTGSSTGIGFAICEHLSKSGHTVLAGFRKPADKANLLALGSGILPIELDVTNETHLARLPTAIESNMKGHDHFILVNNAGVAVWGPLEETPLDDYRKQFEVNLFGSIRAIQVCLPNLRKSKGRIINISSISGLMASPFMSPYSSSKFAMEAIADSLRIELLNQDIKVININPGPIKTPIWNKALESEKAQIPNPTSRYSHQMKKFKTQIEKAVENAPTPAAVITALDEAANNANPKFNYVVGNLNIRFAIRITKFLPKRWLVYLIRRV